MHKQVGKYANKVNATFPMFPEASPAEKVPLHDWDVLLVPIPFGGCNGTDPLLLICDILQCFFKITQIVELFASS